VTPAPSDSLFAYGTLQIPEIMSALCGLATASRSPTAGRSHPVEGSAWAALPARLQGFERCCVRGERFPGIRPRPETSTPGCLYSDLGDEHWELLDAFEGELYERRSVEVQLLGPQASHPLARSATGTSDRTDAETPIGVRTAWVYVVRPGHWRSLLAKPWHIERFAALHVAEYVQTCQQLRAEVLDRRG